MDNENTEDETSNYFLGTRESLEHSAILRSMSCATIYCLTV